MGAVPEHEISRMTRTSLDGSMQINFNYEFILRVESYLKTRGIGKEKFKKCTTEQILKMFEDKVDKGIDLDNEDKEHILKGKIAEAEQDIQECITEMKRITKCPQRRS